MKYRIIGIGNEFRSDDGIGIHIVRELKNRYPELNTSESDGNGVELLSLYQGNDLLIIIDAAYAEKEEDIGKILHLNLNETVDFSNIKLFSSHSFGLVESLKMGKILNAIPDETHLYLVFARDFSFGNKISEEVKQSTEKIISLIIENHFNYILSEN